MPDTPEEAARLLHEELLELLKRLNRDAEEETQVVGLEVEELRFQLERTGHSPGTAEQVRTGLSVLVANGYVERRTDPEYAWNRGRTIGERYAITTTGKEYLLRELERVGRIA